MALLLRVRTVAGKQFAIGRALNRLIKLAFEKHGIAMRDPTAIVLTSPTAPPLEADIAPAAELVAALRKRGSAGSSMVLPGDVVAEAVPPAGRAASARP